MVMLICIRQHLSKTCSSVHEKVKATLRLSSEKALLLKEACIFAKPSILEVWQGSEYASE